MTRQWLMVPVILMAAVTLVWITPSLAVAAPVRDQPLESYRQAWCQQQKGHPGFRLIEGNECDCLTATHAVAIDYADRWAEVMGRSLDFARQTGRKPGVVLVMERAEDRKYQINLRATIDAFKLGVNFWFTGSGAPGADETSLDSETPLLQRPAEGPGKKLAEGSKPPSQAGVPDVPLETLTKNYLQILNENQAIMAYNIGLAYHKKGELQRAILEYTNALESNPRFAKALQNRAAAYYHLGDEGKALIDLNMAIDIDASLAQAYFNRAVIWEKRGQLDKALADYKKASELEPENENFSGAAKEMKWRVFWQQKPTRGY